MSAARDGGRARDDSKSGWRPPGRSELLLGLVVGRAGTLADSEGRGADGRYAEVLARARHRARFASWRGGELTRGLPGADYESYCQAMARFAAASRRGDTEAAEREARAATRYAERLDREAQGEALAWDCRAESTAALSQAANAAGRAEEAAGLLKQAAAWAESGSGDPTVLAALRLAEGRLSRDEGRPWQAVVAYGHAFAYSAVVGDPGDQAEALLGQAEVLAELGETLYAEEAAALALLALEPGREPPLELRALDLLSQLFEVE